MSPPSAAERAPARGYVPALDGLRALSIVPVVLHHSTPRPLAGALGRGPLGVDLFFAISGFLITTLLLRERARTGRVSLRRFYLRRALRIFPAYYAVLMAHLLLAPYVVGPDVAQHFRANFVWFSSYTTNWFVDFSVPHPVLFSYAWSLAVEEQFYALFPLVLALSPAAAYRLIPALVTVVLLVLDSAFERVNPFHGALSRVATSFAPPIGLGCLTALAVDHPAIGPRTIGILRAPAIRSALFVVLGLAFFVGIPLPIAWIALALLVAAIFVSPRGPDVTLLASPPLRFVGRASYAMYLTHVAALGVVRRVFPEHAGSTAFVFALGFPLSLVFAEVLRRSIEKPFLVLKERFEASP